MCFNNFTCIISLDTGNLVITESGKTYRDKFLIYGSIEYKCGAETKRFGNIQRNYEKCGMVKGYICHKTITS